MSPRVSPHVSLIILLCIAVWLFSCILWHTFANPSPLSSSIEERLEKAQTYLSNHISPDGSVTYDYDVVLHQPIEATYEAAQVRDAGIAFSAAMLYAHDHDPAMETAAQEYVDAFFARSTAVAHQDATGEDAIVYSAISLIGENDPVWASRYQASMAGLLQRILARQLPSGAFADSAIDATENPYYTGEALLALSYAIEQPSSGMSTTTIATAIAKTYGGISAGIIAPQDAKSLYMWLNRATVRLIASPYFSSGDKASFKQAVESINTETLANILPIDPRANSCIWGEGIGQYLLIAPTSNDPSLRALLGQIVSDNLALQATNSDHYGSSINDGGFLPEAGSVTARIDYTQHCIGMLLTYEELKGERY